MIQTLSKLLTFTEFINWLPENSDQRYELHNGNIIEMAQPLGEHEEVKGFLTIKLSVTIDRLNLPYFIANQSIIKPIGKDSGYFPDILVINRANLGNEKLWQKESTLSLAASIPLVVEIVSTNWRDDYYLKYADYEEMGIQEYWIIDYGALGGRKFVGNPKQKTISICNLVEGEYQISKFQNQDVIVSQIFPELHLTANQIFTCGNEGAIA